MALHSKAEKHKEREARKEADKEAERKATQELLKAYLERREEEERIIKQLTALHVSIMLDDRCPVLDAYGDVVIDKGPTPTPALTPANERYADQLIERLNKIQTEKAALETKWRQTHTGPLWKNLKLYTAEQLMGESAEAAEEGGRHLTREAFQERLESELRARSNTEIVQDLKEAALSPADLLIPGAKQEQAIRICLPRPEAEALLALLVSNPAEAQARLKALQKPLDEIYSTIEALNVDLNQFEEERVTQKIGETLKTVLTSAKENPIPAALAIVALGAGAYMLWNHVFGDKMKKAAYWAGGIGLGAWALNYGSSLFTKDGRTLLQRFLYDPDQKSFNYVTNRLKAQLGPLTEDSETAFQALMFLKNARASTFAEAFEETLGADPDQREIDPTLFLAQGDIPSAQAQKINARGLYEGIEALMLLVADKHGISGGDRDYRTKEGLRIFKQKYATPGHDLRFQFFVADLMGVTAPSRVNEDGSSAMGTPEHLGERNPESNAIERLFEGFGTKEEVTVTHLEKDIYLFNGYPLEVKKEVKPGKTSYKIADPTDYAGLSVELVKEAGAQTLYADRVVEHIKKKVEDGFESQYTPPSDTSVSYVKERDRWEVTGLTFSKDFNNIFKTDFTPRLYVVPGLDGFLQLRMELLKGDEIIPDDGNYSSIDAALKKCMETAVHEKIKKDMNFIIGDLVFEISSNLTLQVIDASGQTELEIKYDGRKGTLYYKNGAVDNYKLDASSPELQKQWEILAAKEAAAFISNEAVTQNFEALQAAYEGQQHAGGLTSFEGAMAYGKQLWERVTGGREAWYRSQEAEWFETVQVQTMELETMIRHDFLVLYKTNPSYNNYLAHRNTNGSGTLAKAAVKVGILKAQAESIANRPTPSTTTIDSNRQREMEALRESNYENQTFRDLMDFVDRELAKPGWDATGDEDLETARSIKNYIRWKIFDLAYPMPQLQESVLTANHRAWMTNLQDKFKNILSVAQLDPDSTSFFGFDRRYDELTFDRALADNGIQAFKKEYPALAGAPIAGVTVPLVAPSRTVGGGLEINEETELLQDAEKKIRAAYGPAMDISPEMKVLAGLRIAYLMTRMEAQVKSKTSRNDTKAEIEKLVDQAQGEGRTYTALQENPQGAITSMLDSVLTGTYKNAWKAPAERAIRVLGLNSHLKDVASIYFKNIVYAGGMAPNGPPYSPEEYTDFFLYECYSQSGGIPENFTWETVKNWFTSLDERKVVAIAGIDTYSEWIVRKGPNRPRIPELDINKMSIKHLEDAKKQAREKFKDWFEDEMDLATQEFFKSVGDFAHIEGLVSGLAFINDQPNWSAMFKSLTDERLNTLLNTITDIGDLDPKMNRFKEFIAAEKAFFAVLLNSKRYHASEVEARAAIQTNYYKIFDDPSKGAKDYASVLTDVLKNYYDTPWRPW